MSEPKLEAWRARNGITPELINKFVVKREASVLSPYRARPALAKVGTFAEWPPEARSIVERVSQVFNVSVDELIDDTKEHRSARVRKVAMSLIYKRLKFPADYVASLFGKKYRSSVANAVRRFDHEMTANSVFRRKVQLV